MTNTQIVPQEEWLKVLTKGLITIPKSWRDDLDLKRGNFIKAKKLSRKIILEPLPTPAPYRLYSQKELEQFLKDDTSS
jgi:AbrB family looped-hinge helix DNA binding protein